MIRAIATTVTLTIVLCADGGPAVAGMAICGDVNASDSLTSGDALLLLRGAVGQDVELVCPSAATPLRTGLTLCYDEAGAGISCAETGQDGEFRFGVERSFTHNGDGTIADS